MADMIWAQPFWTLRAISPSKSSPSLVRARLLCCSWSVISYVTRDTGVFSPSPVQPGRKVITSRCGGSLSTVVPSSIAVPSGER
jgi:hypothetical protein